MRKTHHAVDRHPAHRTRDPLNSQPLLLVLSLLVLPFGLLLGLKAPCYCDMRVVAFEYDLHTYVSWLFHYLPIHWRNHCVCCDGVKTLATTLAAKSTGMCGESARTKFDATAATGPP